MSSLRPVPEPGILIVANRAFLVSLITRGVRQHGDISPISASVLDGLSERSDSLLAASRGSSLLEPTALTPPRTDCYLGNSLAAKQD